MLTTESGNLSIEMLAAQGPVGTRGGVEWMRRPCACPGWGATFVLHKVPKGSRCHQDKHKAQYISNRDKGCGLGQQFGALRSHQDDHKIFKALPRFKRLRWGQIALLGFVFLIDLLDLPTSDAQASLRQQVTSQPLEEALGVPPLHGWLLLTSLIGDRFADLKNRFGK